jgi:hypothetical protein
MKDDQRIGLSMVDDSTTNAIDPYLNARIVAVYVRRHNVEADQIAAVIVTVQ